MTHTITAQVLRAALRTQHVTIRHGQALELVAALHGARDWNTLSARPDQAPLPERPATRALDTHLRAAGHTLTPSALLDLWRALPLGGTPDFAVTFSTLCLHLDGPDGNTDLPPTGALRAAFTAPTPSGAPSGVTDVTVHPGPDGLTHVTLTVQPDTLLTPEQWADCVHEARTDPTPNAAGRLALERYLSDGPLTEWTDVMSGALGRAWLTEVPDTASYAVIPQPA